MREGTVRLLLGLVVTLVVTAGSVVWRGDQRSVPAGPVLTAPEADRAAGRLALQVRTLTCDGTASGSGFAAGITTLVTNRHVIDGASGVRFVRGDGLSLAAGATAAAYTHDLAIVTLDRPIPDVVTLADRDPLPGDQVLVAGFPLGGPLQLTRGQVVDSVLDVGGVTALRLSAAVAPGSSGSPVFDERGLLVAVVYAEEVGTGYAVAVPVSALRATLAEPPATVPTASC